jgi:hypothetical protein
MYSGTDKGEWEVKSAIGPDEANSTQGRVELTKHNQQMQK